MVNYFDNFFIQLNVLFSILCLLISSILLMIILSKNDKFFWFIKHNNHKHKVSMDVLFV